jgi:uncharacterized lipoprotein YajG
LCAEDSIVFLLTNIISKFKLWREKMKKNISIIISIVLVTLIFAGCSSQETTSTTVLQQTSEQQGTSLTEALAGDTVSRDISDNIRFATLSMGSS